MTNTEAVDILSRVVTRRTPDRLERLGSDAAGRVLEALTAAGFTIDRIDSQHREFPDVHPRMPGVSRTPVCIGDVLSFADPDNPYETVEVEVASLHFDSTDYGEDEPFGWVVAEAGDDAEYPLDEMISVARLGACSPDRSAT